jgi:hypothetical protein
MRQVTGFVLASVALFALSSADGLASPGQGKVQPSMSRAKAMVEGLERNVGLANLERSPHLDWTRKLLASPGSDWGIEGLGRAFTEKRSALANLELATRTSVALEKELDGLRQRVSKLDLPKRWKIYRMGAALAKGRKAIAREREELRQTSAIWAHQGVLTYAAEPAAQQVIEDVLDDRPGQTEAVKGHIDRYLESKYGLK